MLEVPQIEIILYKYYLVYYSRLDLRVLLSQFFSLLDNLFNGSHHVESLLGQSIVFTLESKKKRGARLSKKHFNPLKYSDNGAVEPTAENALEPFDCFFEGHQFSQVASKHFCHLEGL